MCIPVGYFDALLQVSPLLSSGIDQCPSCSGIDQCPSCLDLSAVLLFIRGIVGRQMPTVWVKASRSMQFESF